MGRETIPADVERAVLVEAGHRCAIPTCRSTTTEIAHITPWAKTHDNSFENLIALYPTCHTRYDQKGEIDRKSIQMYKHNLGIINKRYSEFELRLFRHIAISGERIFVLGAGGDILVANAVLDGFFEDKHVEGIGFNIESSDGFSKSFPLTFTYWVTDTGMNFIHRLIHGEAID